MAMLLWCPQPRLQDMEEELLSISRKLLQGDKVGPP
jgi:hypothetical protein